MVRYAASSILCAAAALAGCGEGLLGEDGLEDLTGHDELDLPGAPAWVVRWMLDDDFTDGDPIELGHGDLFVNYEDEEEIEFEYVDFLEVRLPAVSSPPEAAIRPAGEDTSFAVGVPMLMNDLDEDGAWQVPGEEEAGDLWGVSATSAFLFVEGNLEELARTQPVGLEMMSDECECFLSIEQGLQYTLIELDVLNLWWELSEVEDDGEDGELEEGLRVLWPDHPSVLTSDHEESFVVLSIDALEDWFEGGIEAFTGPAWWTWFRDEGVASR